MRLLSESPTQNLWKQINTLRSYNGPRAACVLGLFGLLTATGACGHHGAGPDESGGIALAKHIDQVLDDPGLLRNLNPDATADSGPQSATATDAADGTKAPDVMVGGDATIDAAGTDPDGQDSATADALAAAADADDAVAREIDQQFQSQAVTDKAAADKLAADKLATDKLAADKLAADKLAADKLAADKLAADKLAAEKVAVQEKTVPRETHEKAEKISAPDRPAKGAKADKVEKPDKPDKAAKADKPDKAPQAEKPEKSEKEEPDKPVKTAFEPVAVPDGADATDLYYSGKRKLDGGNLAGAVADLKASQQLRPSTRTLTLLGRALFDAGEMSAATKVLQAAGNYEDAQLLLGTLYQHQSKTAQARKVYEAFLKAHPDHAKAEWVRNIIKSL